MEGKIILLGQFIVCMSFIVGLHELGHLLAAKLFGMRVESYGIGLPPKIVKINYKDTEYYIGAIPLGGAVVIKGRINEDTPDGEDKEGVLPKEWEFRAKPAWQRLIVTFGGIIFNVFSAILIFATISSLTLRDKYVSKSELNSRGIVPTDFGEAIGFRFGDKIIKIDGKDFESYDELLKGKNGFGEVKTYTINRDGEELEICLSETDMIKLKKEHNGLFFIGQKYLKNLQSREKEFMDYAVGTNRSGYIDFQYRAKIIDLYAENSMYKTLDSYLATNNDSIKESYKKIGVLAALGVGCRVTWMSIVNSFYGIYKLITGKVDVSRSLSGPIGIAKVFGTTFELINFLGIVAALSIVLAVMNFLPLPALDGGHGILIIYEMVTGRVVSTKNFLRFQKVGLLILLLLTAYTTINDLYKIFK